MPSGPHRRFLALPLRAKLTVLNTLVVLLVSVTALVTVRHGLRWMLIKELKVALEDEVYELALAGSVEQTPGAAEEDGSPGEASSTPLPPALTATLEETSAGHIRHGWFLQLFGAEDGQPLWSSRNTPAAFQSASFSLDQPEIEREGHSYRFAQRRLPVARAAAAGAKTAPAFLVRLGTSLDFIEEDVANVTRIIAPVLTLVFLLAPLGGYLLSGWATAPLQRLIATSRQLHPSRLDERLPLAGTGDEIDVLSREINEFLDQIAQHLRRNREFVANAAHELRSPLSAITTSLDVAVSRPRSVEEYQDLLSTLLDECQQLNALANQLLLLAESDAGLLGRRRTPVRLDEVVNASREVFAAVADDRGVALAGQVESGVNVRADRTRLWQVVNNLLDNALKFTPSGGRVEVDLRAGADRREAVLTVRDTGVGIPAADLPFVFDRFYQVERSRHHAEVVHGTGLGLSICRSIVSAYDGTIGVESAPGQGTVVMVRLPLLVVDDAAGS
jgi:heavy metal sensor kinase